MKIIYSIYDGICYDTYATSGVDKDAFSRNLKRALQVVFCNATIEVVMEGNPKGPVVTECFLDEVKEVKQLAEETEAELWQSMIEGADFTPA